MKDTSPVTKSNRGVVSTSAYSALRRRSVGTVPSSRALALAARSALKASMSLSLASLLSS